MHKRTMTTGPLGIGTGSAVFQLPYADARIPPAPSFTSLLASNHIQLKYVKNNPSLVNAQI